MSELHIVSKFSKTFTMIELEYVVFQDRIVRVGGNVFVRIPRVAPRHHMCWYILLHAVMYYL